MPHGGCVRNHLTSIVVSPERQCIVETVSPPGQPTLTPLSPSQLSFVSFLQRTQPAGRCRCGRADCRGLRPRPFACTASPTARSAARAAAAGVPQPPAARTPSSKRPGHAPTDAPPAASSPPRSAADPREARLPPGRRGRGVAGAPGAPPPPLHLRPRCDREHAPRHAGSEARPPADHGGHQLPPRRGRLLLRRRRAPRGGRHARVLPRLLHAGQRGRPRRRVRGHRRRGVRGHARAARRAPRGGQAGLPHLHLRPNLQLPRAVLLPTLLLSLRRCRADMHRRRPPAQWLAEQLDGLEPGGGDDWPEAIAGAAPLSPPARPAPGGPPTLQRLRTVHPPRRCCPARRAQRRSRPLRMRSRRATRTARRTTSRSPCSCS